MLRRLLRQITVRMAINWLTRHRPLARGVGESDAIDNAPAVGATPLEEMVRAERASELYRGMERLKPVDRATLSA